MIIIIIRRCGSVYLGLGVLSVCDVCYVYQEYVGSAVVLYIWGVCWDVWSSRRGDNDNGCSLWSILELKRRLFNFPAPLSECWVSSLCEVVPVSHTLYSRNFSKCWNSVDSALCPRNHNRSGARPVLFSLLLGYSKWRLNTIKRLEKGILQKLYWKFSDRRAFSFLRPFQAAGHITTT